jgi:dsRNA-specific ribonuclease
MRARYISETNRKEIQRKYIDQILGELDFMQIKDRLRDYLQHEKDKESNYALESEIRKEAPEVLVENWEDFNGPATLTEEEHYHA